MEQGLLRKATKILLFSPTNIKSQLSVLLELGTLMLGTSYQFKHF